MKRLLILIESINAIIGLWLLVNPRAQQRATEALAPTLLCCLAIIVLAGLSLLIAIIRSQVRPPYNG